MSESPEVQHVRAEVEILQGICQNLGVFFQRKHRNIEIFETELTHQHRPSKTSLSESSGGVTVI